MFRLSILLSNNPAASNLQSVKREGKKTRFFLYICIFLLFFLFLFNLFSKQEWQKFQGVERNNRKKHSISLSFVPIVMADCAPQPHYEYPSSVSFGYGRRLLSLGSLKQGKEKLPRVLLFYFSIHLEKRNL